jgi:hypothetical protein
MDDNIQNRYVYASGGDGQWSPARNPCPLICSHSTTNVAARQGNDDNFHRSSFAQRQQTFPVQQYGHYSDGTRPQANGLGTSNIYYGGETLSAPATDYYSGRTSSGPASNIYYSGKTFSAPATDYYGGSTSSAPASGREGKQIGARMHNQGHDLLPQGSIVSGAQGGHPDGQKLPTSK